MRTSRATSSTPDRTPSRTLAPSTGATSHLDHALDAARGADHSGAGSSTTPRRAALVAGVGYVALFVLGIFANFIVLEGLQVPGDAAATVAAMSDSQTLWRLGMAAFLVIFLVDVVVAWALHVVFRDVHRDLSLATAWFRLAYTVMLGVGLVDLVAVQHLVGGAEPFTAMDEAATTAQVMLHLESFNAAWMIGLVAFGIHLVLLGRLVLTGRRASRILGWALVAAGLAYGVDTFATLLLPDYDAVASLLLVVVAVPSVVAEGWMAGWLLLRAGRSPQAVAAAA